MFKELQENTSKELNQSMRIVCCQMENINKEIRIIKKNHIAILELKSTMIEMKNSLGNLISIFEWTEEKINN